MMENASYVYLVSNSIHNLLKSVKAGDASINLSTSVIRNDNTIDATDDIRVSFVRISQLKSEIFE